MQVEDLLGIPAFFEVLHQAVNLVAIEQLDEFATESAVAVLTAERAFVFFDQEGGFVRYFAEFS